MSALPRYSRGPTGYSGNPGTNTGTTHLCARSDDLAARAGAHATKQSGLSAIYPGVYYPALYLWSDDQLDNRAADPYDSLHQAAERVRSTRTGSTAGAASIG